MGGVARRASCVLLPEVEKWRRTFAIFHATRDVAMITACLFPTILSGFAILPLKRCTSSFLST